MLSVSGSPGALSNCATGSLTANFNSKLKRVKLSHLYINCLPICIALTFPVLRSLHTAFRGLTTERILLYHLQPTSNISRRAIQSSGHLLWLLYLMPRGTHTCGAFRSEGFHLRLRHITTSSHYAVHPSDRSCHGHKRTCTLARAGQG